MPVNDPPFPTDAEPKNLTVVPAGSYFWLKTRLRVSNLSPAPPDGNALQRLNFAVVQDPDGNILSSWRTTAPDPTTPGGDPYTSAHPSYVGLQALRQVADGAATLGSGVITSATAAFNALADVGKPVTGPGIAVGATIASVQSATQATLSAPSTATGSSLTFIIGAENVGLFAEGGASAPTGRFAQKLLAAGNAEQTIGTGRHFKITWGILRGGNVVTDYELFDIGPTGVLVFGDEAVTVTDLRALYDTPQSDPQLQALIARGVLNVGNLVGPFIGGIPTASDSYLTQAVIAEALRLLVMKEITNSRAANSVSQGGMSLSLPDALERAKLFMEERDNALRAYLRAAGVVITPGVPLDQVRNPTVDVMRTVPRGQWTYPSSQVIGLE